MESENINNQKMVANTLTILEDRKNAVISLLTDYGIEPGDNIYQEVANLDYSSISDWLLSQLHAFGTTSNPYSIAANILNDFSSHEAKQLICAIHYLELSNLLDIYLSSFISNDKGITDAQCLTVGGLFAEMERCGVGIGLKSAYSTSQRQKAKNKSGTKGIVRLAFEKICTQINSTSFNDFIEAIEPVEDGDGPQDNDLVADLYEALTDPIQIHHFELSDSKLSFMSRDGQEESRSIGTIKNILSKIKL